MPFSILNCCRSCLILCMCLCVPHLVLAACRIWKLVEGECEQVLQGHAGRVNSVKLCDVKHTAMTVSDDFTARVWDWSTGECRHVLQGHGGWLSDMALLPNASRAVTVSGDDLAVLWDLQEGKCCNVLEGHSAQANSVVLTRRGRYACRARSSHCLCLHATIFSSVLVLGALAFAISCCLSSFLDLSGVERLLF